MQDRYSMPLVSAIDFVDPVLFTPDPASNATLEKFRIRIQTIFSRFLNIRFCKKIFLFNVRSSTVAQKVAISFFFTWKILFCASENFCHSILFRIKI